MSLLALEAVGKRDRRGPRERVALTDISLQLEAGELAMVWGLRGSGRSTLLRVAAGIEPPDAGVVRFEGQDLAAVGEDVLGTGIGYCQTRSRAGEGTPVLEEVTVALLARGLCASDARSRAHAALERVDAMPLARLRRGELDSAEAVRVALARALALQPRLLMIDEPTKGVDLLARDGILLLLRSLADQGITVLATTGESTGLSGADRALALSEGGLRSTPAPEFATVFPLRRAAGHA
jgi:putative ABC transport system ATP-binding protein